MGGDDDYGRQFEIVDRARSLVGDELGSYLNTACGDDAALRARVDELLAFGREESCDAFSDANISNCRVALEELVGDASDASETWLPEKIRDYKVLRQIGRGGMGIVYEAEQKSPRRSVAIKLLHPIQATAERSRRFRHEAELLGRLKHPGIAQIHEASTYDVGNGPQPFFAMELVDGVDIRTHCERAGLQQRARIELLAQVCDAVQYAHDHGVVHRDLKPDNVLVNELGKPIILDFGVARATDQESAMSSMMTQQGQLVGTLAYMAPEQLDYMAGDVTPLVDVYALGVLAFELLVGQLPRAVDDTSVTRAIAALASAEPVRASRCEPSLRGDLDTILAKALEADPQRRYASASAIAADLRRHLAHEPILARPPSRVYLARKFTRRHRALVGGTLATMLTLLVGIAVTIVFARDAADQAELSAANENRANNGLHQSAQILIDAGRERDAVGQLRLVPREARGVAWRLLRRSAPALLELPPGDYCFVGEEHVVGACQTEDLDGGIQVYSLVEDRVIRSEFAGEGITSLAQQQPTGWNISVMTDHESLLLDLKREVVLKRGPRQVAREDVPDVQRPGETKLIERVRRSEVSEDGRTVLWFSSPNVAEVHVDGKVVRTVRGLSALEGARIGADGRDLVINRSQEVTVVDIATGRLRFRHRCDADPGAVGAPVLGGVVMRHRTQILNEAMPVTWRRWGLPADAPLLEPADAFVGGVVFDIGGGMESSFSRDGRILAVTRLVGGGGAAVLANPETGERLNKSVHIDGAIEVGGALHQMGIAFAVLTVGPSGKSLMLSSRFLQPEILAIDARVNEADYDPRVLTLRGHQDADGNVHGGWVYDVAVSRDGSMLASVSPNDPWIRVWDARTGQQIANLKRDFRKLGYENTGTWESFMAFAPDGDRLVLTTPYEGKGVSVVDWNLVTGDVTVPASLANYGDLHLLLLDDYLEALSPVPGQRLSARAQMLGEHALAVHFPPDPGGRYPRLEHGTCWSYVAGIEQEAEGMSVHPDGLRVAVVQQIDDQEGRGRLTVVEVSSGNDVIELELAGKPWCVAYSPDGKTLGIGCHDGHVLLFETGRYTQQLSYRGHEKYVHAIAWTPDGTRIVTASGDATVRIVDTRTLVASRIDNDRWRELRSEMAQRSDLRDVVGSMTGMEHAAARVELVRRTHGR